MKRLLPQFLAIFLIISTVFFSKLLAIVDPVPTAYNSFEGDDLKLFAWEGEEIAILTKSDTLNPDTMDEILMISYPGTQS